MTTDLSAAERRLAEALRDYPDEWLRLRGFAMGLCWDVASTGEAIVFAATYELARRERERENHATV